MQIKTVLKSLLAINLACCAFASHADIKVTNHTGYYGTAKTNFTPCSSISPKGVMQPYGTLEVSQSVLNSFCKVIDCKVDLYISKNCSGPKVAVVTISAKSGIKSIEHKMRNKVHVTGRGNFAVINPA